MERANFLTTYRFDNFFKNKYESKKSKTENVICFGGIEISTFNFNKVNFVMSSNC